MAKRVCVFGSYKNLAKKEKENIINLGRLLAESGFEVITGGFGGTMEDISKGAKLAGGKTIGITYYKNIDAPNKGPNKYVDREIRAKSIFERIEIMIRDSDAFIVLPGGTGTLLELAACLEYINKGLSEPKPIIGLGNFWKNIAERLSDEAILSETTRSTLNALCCRDLITFVDTPQKLVTKLNSSI